MASAYNFITDFLGGVNSYAPPMRTRENNVVEASNCYVTENGVLTRRPAFRRLGALTVSAGRDRTLAMIAAGEGAQHKVYCLMSNTNTQGAVIHAWDGTTWTTAAIGIVAAEEGSLAWVVESSETEYIYATGAADISVNAVGRYTFTAPGVAPVGGLLGLSTSPPTNCRYIVSHAERVWLGGQQGFTGGPSRSLRNILYYSASYPTMEIFDNAKNRLLFLTESGQKITGISPYGSGAMFVGLNRACMIFIIGTGNLALDGDIQTISRDIGLGSHRSIANVGEDLYFVDQAGNVRSLAMMRSEQGSPVKSSPLSLAIKDKTEQSTIFGVPRTVAAYFDGNYWISFNLANGTKALYNYNVVLGSWFGPHTIRDNSGNACYVVGMTVGHTSPGGTNFDDRKSHLYFMTDKGTAFGTSRFQLFELDSTAILDDSTATIEMSFTTKARDFETPHLDKEWRYLELLMRRKTVGTFTLEARVNLESKWYEFGRVDYSEGSDEYIYKTVDLRVLPRGRTIQFRMVCDETLSSPEIVNMVVSFEEHKDTRT